MKTLIAFLTALSICVLAFSFEIYTPERKKADEAWERTIRRDFDFERLHDFLLRTLAEQKRFEEVDLVPPKAGERWVVSRVRRTLVSGEWWFKRDEKGSGFQLRYYPGEGDHEVVLVCERKARGKFRFIEIKWDRLILHLAHHELPNQALQPTPMLVTCRADARPAPSIGVADL